MDDLLPLGGGNRPNLAAWWANQGTFHHRRRSLLIQKRNQRFAHSQLENDLLDIDCGIGAESLRRRLDGFLVFGGKGAHRMLHAVAELAQNAVGDVNRVLGNEEDAYALGTDQTNHLVDLVFDHLGQIGKKKVGFVEEEDQLGLFRVAHLRQALEELAQQPQQERGIELGRVDEFVRGQDVDHAMPLGVCLHQVVEVERRLTQKLVPALLLQGEQASLHRSHAGRGDVAVLGLKLLGIAPPHTAASPAGL